MVNGKPWSKFSGRVRAAGVARHSSLRRQGVSDRDPQERSLRASGHDPSRGAFYTTPRSTRSQSSSCDGPPKAAMRDATACRNGSFTVDGRRRGGAARIAQGAARAVARPRRDPRVEALNREPRSGIRNDQSTTSRRMDPQAHLAARQAWRQHSAAISIEEYSPDSLTPRSLIPSRSLWYWRQTIAAALFVTRSSRSPQQSLTYPRSHPCGSI